MSDEEFRNDELNDLQAQIDAAVKSSFHQEKDSWLSDKSRLSFVLFFSAFTAGAIALAMTVIGIAQFNNRPSLYTFNNGFYIDSTGQKHELVGDKYKDLDKDVVVKNVQEFAVEIETQATIFKAVKYQHAEWQTSDADNDYEQTLEFWYNNYNPSIPNSPVRFVQLENPLHAHIGKKVSEVAAATLNKPLPDWMKTRVTVTDPNPADEVFSPGAFGFGVDGYHTIRNQANKLLQLNFTERFNKSFGDSNAFACINGQVDKNTNAWRAYEEFIEAFQYDHLYKEDVWTPKCTADNGNLVDIESLWNYCENRQALFIPELAGDGGTCPDLITRRPSWNDNAKKPGMDKKQDASGNDLDEYALENTIYNELHFSVSHRMAQSRTFQFIHPPRNSYIAGNDWFEANFSAWVARQPAKTEIDWNRHRYQDRDTALTALNNWIHKNISYAWLTKTKDETE